MKSTMRSEAMPGTLARPRSDRYIFIACPWTEKGGGMFKVADYLLQAQDTASVPETAAHLRSLDTRGGGGAVYSLWVLCTALMQIVLGRFSGRLAGVHVNMAERLSLFRKSVIIVASRLLGIPVVLHLHAASTVLAVRQARQLLPDLPIVAGSAMHQPATAALLEPAELRNVCAETASSPISAGTPEMRAFLDAYRTAYKSDPDAYAAAQYDAVQMLAHILRDLGAKATPEAVRARLASDTYRGIAGTYHSDGKGNMAHDSEIICYDGKDRAPRIEAHY